MAVNQLLSQSVCVVIPILNIFSLAPKQMVLHSNERLNRRNDNNRNENETLRNINWKGQNWCFCWKAPMKKLDVHIDRSAICEPSATLQSSFSLIEKLFTVKLPQFSANTCVANIGLHFSLIQIHITNPAVQFTAPLPHSINGILYSIKMLSQKELY